jgi:hypothetical protein
MIGLSCGLAEPRLEAEFELEEAEAGFEVEGADVDIATVGEEVSALTPVANTVSSGIKAG